MPRPRLILFAFLAAAGLARADFVNFETPPVHPLALSPDGSTLALCHTADNRVEFFDLTGATPRKTGAVYTGIDPVSVRWRNADELWVVNQLSDSISIVDPVARTVLRTLFTDDEPADVVFAGAPRRAFVTCSQADTVLVFDPAAPASAPQRLAIEGEDPRALAVSPDGLTVYAAIFESGNRSTILMGGANDLSFPPNAVSNPLGPYGGQNPPPNDGAGFTPAQRPGNPAPKAVGLIVKQDAQDRWMDDNGGDWTDLVSGANAAASGRVPGWELIDNDVAVIDTGTLGITYVEGLMNICMAMAVNPLSGRVCVVGTDATNEIRFEPNIKGTFLRVCSAGFVDPLAPSVADLNPHLDYASATLPQAERNKSIGDPRGVAWRADGSRGYVAGMGSDNLVVIDALGRRIPAAPAIEVGEGPVGLAVDDARNRLYVFNRFDASLSVVNLVTEAEILRIPLFDPTPAGIKAGRPFLYDTHRSSGLGHTACASCHVDARMDRLAWDLGDPSGEMDAVDALRHNLGANLPGLNTDFDTAFHPMKGPMTTQTMQDIIGKEPLHWRGDRDGLESFNPAFIGLQGDDTLLSAAEMQAFENYLASLHFPPNPFRNLDNSLPENLPLPGEYSTGRFSPAGTPLPNGNAKRALDTLYRPLNRGIDGTALACVTCHTLPTGLGTDTTLSGFTLTPIPPGPDGERHHALVSVDGSTQKAIKVVQLRNLYDKAGFETTRLRSRAGFGFAHDGAIPSMTGFLTEPVFEPADDQEVADLVALMMAFSGSDFGPAVDGFEPPGTASQDAHAAVGQQAVRTDAAGAGGDHDRMSLLLALAEAGRIEVVVKGDARGWRYAGGNQFACDGVGPLETLAGLLARAGPATPLVFTAVPNGTARRIGIDRDRDDLLDFDETRDLDPAVTGIQNPFSPDDPDATGDNGALGPDGVPDAGNDFDNDGVSNLDELRNGTNPADNLSVEVALGLGAAVLPDGSVRVIWAAAPLGEYVLYWSADLDTWTRVVENPIRAGVQGGFLEWTDTGPIGTPTPPGSAPRRYYRAERLR